MSIVKTDGADAYCRRPPASVKFFLVHGNDEGLIHERAKTLVHAVLGGDPDPMRLMRIEGDTLSKEPGLLADEAYAVSMFGGSRALWVDVGSRDLLATLGPLLERPPTDCTLILEAGSVKKGSALRNLFERSGEAASIECYPDERRALLGLIDSEAREAGLEISPEARDYLVGLLGNDRLTSRGEVAKLVMYCRGTGKIDIAAVEAIVSDAAPSGLDEMIDNALAGELGEAEKKAGRYFGEGGDPGEVVRRLVSRIMLLHQLRVDMDHGKSFDAAMAGVFVRLSPDARKALARQADRWTSAALGKRVVALQAVVGRARRDARLSPVTVTRALWVLANAARAGRR